MQNCLELDVLNRQYYIAANLFNLENWDFAFHNGLVATLDRDGFPADPGEVAVICTGTDSGPIALTVEARSEPPALVDTESWEDIVEFSVTLTGQCPAILPPVSLVPAVEFPLLPEGSGVCYRMRLHVRGRDRGLQVGFIDPDSDPVEEHLIITWPAEAAHSVEHRLSDRVGQLKRSQAADASHTTTPAPPTGVSYNQGGFSVNDGGSVRF